MSSMPPSFFHSNASFAANIDASYDLKWMFLMQYDTPYIIFILAKIISYR